MYLHCRLLVRAVGLLEYEEDVERLLLESVASEFKKGVRQIRLDSSLKLGKISRKIEGDTTDEMVMHYEVNNDIIG